MCTKSCNHNFTHLHLHTQYSLLDGANLIPELVPYLKENKMNSCAITDHGWMAGIIEFYKECKKGGVKPIIGVEAYITEDEDGKEKDKTRDNMHMVLLAKDEIGYQKLLQLSTEAALDNFYYKPRIYKPKLRSLAGHVVATSACLGGIVAKKLIFNKDSLGNAIECVDEFGMIKKELEFYLDVFGDDFYLELQDWDSGDHFQPVYNEFLTKTGKDMGMQFVITADAHYLKRDDDQLHEMLMAMQLGQTLEQYRSSPEMQYGPHFYVKSPDEMLIGAKKYGVEEAYWNTGLIAEKCNVDIELGKYKEPVFKIEETEDYNEFLDWKKTRNVSQLECTHHEPAPPK